MSDNKYKMFRNFMTNELGISKEDIKEWTMQSIKETVEKYLRGFSIEDVATKFVGTKLRDSWLTTHALEKAVEQVVKEKLDFTVKVKEE